MAAFELPSLATRQGLAHPTDLIRFFVSSCARSGCEVKQPASIAGEFLAAHYVQSENPTSLDRHDSGDQSLKATALLLDMRNHGGLGIINWGRHRP
jgi:hypothetical protein